MNIPRQVLSGESCGWCFEKCDPNTAQLLALNCSECGWGQYHEKCFIKKTKFAGPPSRPSHLRMHASLHAVAADPHLGLLPENRPRQRNAFSRKNQPQEELVCPKIREYGSCEGHIEQVADLMSMVRAITPSLNTVLLSLTRRTTPPPQAKAPQAEAHRRGKEGEEEGEAPSLSFMVNGIPKGAGSQELAMYLAMYGAMPQIKATSGGMIATFADEASIQAMLKEAPHSIDGVTRLELRRLPPKSKSVQQQEAKVEGGAKLYVGKLPSFATEKSVRDHFSLFGALKEVKIPEPFRGVATVEFHEASSAMLALGCPAHLISGEAATVRRHQAITSRAKRGAVNTSLAWNLIQQGNMGESEEAQILDPEVTFCTIFPPASSRSSWQTRRFKGVTISPTSPPFAATSSLVCDPRGRS